MSKVQNNLEAFHMQEIKRIFKNHFNHICIYSERYREISLLKSKNISILKFKIKKIFKYFKLQGDTANHKIKCENKEGPEAT